MPEQRKPFFRRPAIRIVAALASIAALYVVYLGFVAHDMSDFGVCYRNGQRILAGETLYRVSDGHMQFKYAPAAALFYSWLAVLPKPVSKVLWYYLELSLLGGCFWIGYRIVPRRAKGAWFVIGIGFAILAKMIGREIELGQVNIFLIFLLLAMSAAFLKRKDAATGALWAVSLLFKPYALVFLPYFILKKRWKTLIWGGGVLLAGLALPVIEFGVRGNFAVLKEWAVTLSRSTPGLMAVGDNASFYAFIWKLLPGDQPGAAKAVWLAFGLATAVALLWMMRRGRTSGIPGAAALELSFLMVLIPFFSPLGWNYNYLYALPAVLLVLGRWPDIPGAWKWILGLNFLVIGGSMREILQTVPFRFYTHHSLIAIDFLILLAGLIALRVRKIA
jgi:hypothetical protein